MRKSPIVPSTTEYALRAMTFLVVVHTTQDGRLTAAEEIARETDIPQTYLSKVLRLLVKRGLLEAERGHGGGFRLARTPKKISFQMILEATGFTFSTDHCAFGWEVCDAKAPCPLHHCYKALEKSFYHWASTTTLADVDCSKKALKRVLR